MKNSTIPPICALAIFLSPIIYGQDTFTQDHFAEHTLSFEVENGKMRGDGADLLKDAISGSQFFLLGEYHNDGGVSELTSALLPLLAKQGYNHFAVETGPISAAKLEEVAESKDVVIALNQFYSTNVILTGDIPIPFFSGVEDADFLEIAVKNGFDLWGLDQEYLDGYLFLLEEAWHSYHRPDRYRGDYEAARKRLTEIYASVSQEESTQVYNQLLNDELILNFMESIAKNHCRSSFNAVDEIIKSATIYRDWRADLLANLEGRTELMKDHFMTYYRQCNERTPKVFLKMGGMHTGRGFTGNADYEMGNFLHEVARFNGSHDVNLAFATRYYLDDDTREIGDNLDYSSEWTENMKPILAQGDKELWKIIDLRPLRKLWINERVKPNAQIRQYLTQNDFIVIMPPRGENTTNYDISLVRD